MIFEYNDYRKFLRSIVSSKNDKTAPSLRSLSKRLEVSTSHLSEILNSKKSLSVEMAFKISLKLRFSHLETQYFCLMVELENESDPVRRQELSVSMASINPNQQEHHLSSDALKSISEWHHGVILELVNVSGFVMTPANVAKRIGISVKVAKAALARLERLQLIRRTEHGSYQQTHNTPLRGASATPDDVLKQFHKQFLNKAETSLYSQDPKERVSCTDILAIDSRFLEEVSRRSEEYSNAITELANRSKVKDSVYALSMHFFKVT
jgi:uncharacterized protein (TIGR02147 family)